MRLRVRCNGAFPRRFFMALFYGTTQQQISVGDDDSGLGAVLESTAPGHWSSPTSTDEHQ
jgi:hypothetical protein